MLGLFVAFMASLQFLHENVLQSDGQVVSIGEVEAFVQLEIFENTHVLLLVFYGIIVLVGELKQPHHLGISNAEYFMPAYFSNEVSVGDEYHIVALQEFDEPKDAVGVFDPSPHILALRPEISKAPT